MLMYEDSNAILGTTTLHNNLRHLCSCRVLAELYQDKSNTVINCHVSLIEIVVCYNSVILTGCACVHPLLEL